MKKLFILLFMLLFITGCDYNKNKINSENLSHTEESCLDSNMLITGSINDGILSELGLNYNQIREKYGEHVNEGYLMGGYYYKFEKGYGCYFFGTDNEELPTDNDLCTTITANVKDLFLGMDVECDFDELMKKYSLFLLEDTEEYFEEFSDTFATCYSIEEYEIVLMTKSAKKVSPNDWAILTKSEVTEDDIVSN